MVPEPASLVWLFDIDGTLLLTQGAGREAISLALRERFGVDDDLRTIPFAGRTDTLILGDILERHGFSLSDGERDQFWQLTAAELNATVRSSHTKFSLQFEILQRPGPPN